MAKRLFRMLLILGWIPTLAVVTGARWLTGAPLVAAAPTPITITRLYTGADGKTKVEEFQVPLRAQGRGTELSTIVPVKSLQFRRTNLDYNLDWHPAPSRQFVITLSGESEVELEGGKRLRLGPGNILLAEDTTGQGHISRALASGDRVSLFIPLADGADVPR